MKSPLRFLLVVSAFMLASTYSFAQVAWPTIDGTLDNIQTLTAVEGNTGATWTVITTGHVKAGAQVRIRMKLDNPADAGKFDLTRLVENVPTVPIVFDSEGIAVLSANEWFTLKEEADPNAAVLHIKFNTPGVYRYELQLQENDGNILATSKETVRVASVAGLDDMIENTRISVYPVPAPANNEVTLHLGELNNASVSVIDLLGKSVYQADKLSGVTKISTAGFSKGVYFIKVIKGSEAAMVRMLVQ